MIVSQQKKCFLMNNKDFSNRMREKASRDEGRQSPIDEDYVRR